MERSRLPMWARESLISRETGSPAQGSRGASELLLTETVTSLVSYRKMITSGSVRYINRIY